MAEERVTTILQVELDAAKVASDLANLTKRIGDVKSAQKELTAQYKAGTITTGEYTLQMTKSKDELRQLTQQQNGLIATTKLLDKETTTYSDTLNGQRQKLSDMLKAYDQLDASVRDSKAGKKFLAEIKEQTAAVSELERSTGRAQRGVGQYEEALRAAGVGLGGLTQKMKAFFANPWALLLGAIVGAFKTLIDAFKRSEDRMKELRASFAPLQGVTDMIKRAFDALAGSLGRLASGALQKVTQGIQWLFRAIDKLASKVGLDWNLSGAFDDAAKGAAAATAAEQKYIEHRRRFVEEEARLQKTIAVERDKVAQADKYTAEERIAALERAMAAERKIANEKKQLAQENLAYLEAEAARTANDATMNDRLAEARAAVTQAETEYYNTTRRLQTQLAATRKEIAAEAKAEAEDAKKEAKESESELRKVQRQSKAALDYRRQVELAALGEAKKYSKDAFDINVKYYDDLLQLYAEDSAEYLKTLEAKAGYEQQWHDKRKELAEKAQTFLAQFNNEDALADKYARQLQALEEYHATGVVSEEQYQRALGEIDEQYTQERVKMMNVATGKLAGMFEEMSAAVGVYAEENEGAAKAQKAFALSGIILNQAQSISEGALATAKGIESAANIPFPYNIPAIISVVATIGSMIASVMSSIAEAKQVFSRADAGGYEHGGVVGGTSYTGDKLIAHVNSGEGIYTPAQANNVLQSLASNPLIGDNERLVEAMVTAVRSMPAPKLVYEEFETFRDKVATYDELASI